MYFEDTANNRDTLYFGFDSASTDSIDLSFGEVDISAIRPDSIFSIRITDEYHKNLSWPSYFDFHTKKQIVNYQCPYFKIIQFEIISRNWPVKASWDSSLFSGICLNGTLITGTPPGGWWDVGSPSFLWQEVLESKSSVLINSNISSNGMINNNYNYVNQYGDSVSYYWFAFGDSTILYSGIEEKLINKAKVFPNPTNDEVIIEHSSVPLRVFLYDLTGKKVLELCNERKIKLASFDNGIYVLQIEFSDGNLETHKIVKRD